MHANRLPLLGIGTQPPRECRKRLPGPGPTPARFELPNNFHHRAGAHVAPTNGFVLNIGRGPTRRRQESTAALCASLAFGGVLVVAVVGGLIGVLTSPSPRTGVESAGIRVADDATCVRISRHADYVTADVAFGTPRTMLSLLVRFDVLTEENSLRIFSSRVVESESVECTASPIACTDIFVVQANGPGSENVAVAVDFNYTNFINEEYGTHPYAWNLQLDGELRLKRGFEYVATTTHLCWTRNVASDYTTGALHATTTWEGGELTATASAVAAFAPLVEAKAPLAVAVRERGCTANASEVHIFPGAAAYETDWLAIGSQRLYETAETGVVDRREVVEVGPVCANAHEEYARAQSLYLLDCAAFSKPCAALPSVPWRRLATAVVAIYAPAADSEDYWVLAAADPTLASLPTLDTSYDALGVAVVKLLLMTLAAAVVWIRAAKETASNAYLLQYALQQAYNPKDKADKADADAGFHPHRKWEDQIVGGVAILARAAVSGWRLHELLVDGFGRVAVAQLVATGLSLLHFVVRWFFLQEDTSPLLRLGGSTALVDAPAAVLLGFASAPLLTSASGQFDPTARMLTALLLTLVSLPRCAFAAACCALRASTALERGYKSTAFAMAATASTAVWLAQALSIGLLLSDAFATPAGYSLQRSLSGGWLPLSVAAFAAVLAAAQPQLMRALSSVVGEE